MYRDREILYADTINIPFGDIYIYMVELFLRISPDAIVDGVERRYLA